MFKQAILQVILWLTFQAVVVVAGHRARYDIQGRPEIRRLRAKKGKGSSNSDTGSAKGKGKGSSSSCSGKGQSSSKDDDDSDDDCGDNEDDIFCIDFVCDNGYSLRENPETLLGSDRATCCIRDGVCAGAPVGSPCSLGDLADSIIPNPSFEDFSTCPDGVAQLDRADSWVQATAATSDFLVGSPTCDDTFFRQGVPAQLIGPIPQQAVDGDAFVATITDTSSYFEYVGACLTSPLFVGVEYTFNLNMAAAASGSSYGGDTNGDTDLLCIPGCEDFPIAGGGIQSGTYQVLDKASPVNGLVGGGAWKSITFQFTPIANCPAIMFGPSNTQTRELGQAGSYVLYDALNLQQGSAGVCNADGLCVDATPNIFV